MEKTKNKKWYAKWWGYSICILIWPVGFGVLLYIVWTSHVNVLVKCIITGLLTFILVGLFNIL